MGRGRALSGAAPATGTGDGGRGTGDGGGHALGQRGLRLLDNARRLELGLLFALRVAKLDRERVLGHKGGGGGFLLLLLLRLRRRSQHLRRCRLCLRRRLVRLRDDRRCLPPPAPPTPSARDVTPSVLPLRHARATLCDVEDRPAPSHERRDCNAASRASPLRRIFAQRTNQTQEARVYSHDESIRRRKRGYILTMNQSDAGSAGIFS
eukprot:993285-Prorocentrum_minimum.AAC.1